MGTNFHPECFVCAYCGKIFANSPFYLEDGLPYCEEDWNELFTTKCISCGFPIEAGDRWVEALNNNYHSQCFNCSVSISVTLSATLLPFSSLSSARKIWRVKASLQKVVKSFAKITPLSIELCKKNLEGQSFFVKAGKPFCKSHARG